MRKRFFQKNTKKYQIRLSPKEADEVLRQEFEDKNGNRHQLNIWFRPHKPNEGGDIRFKYKQGEQE